MDSKSDASSGSKAVLYFLNISSSLRTSLAGLSSSLLTGSLNLVLFGEGVEEFTSLEVEVLLFELFVIGLPFTLKLVLGVLLLILSLLLFFKNSLIEVEFLMGIVCGSALTSFDFSDKI